MAEVLEIVYHSEALLPGRGGWREVDEERRGWGEGKSAFCETWKVTCVANLEHPGQCAESHRQPCDGRAHPS